MKSFQNGVVFWAIIVITTTLLVQSNVAEEEDEDLDDRDVGGAGVRNKSGSVPLYELSAVNVLPTILLKRQKNHNPDIVNPSECTEMEFMHPFHWDITFPDVNKSAEMKASKYCNWAFIGTEACVPQLSCSKFNLPQDCDQTYMLVVDGDRGMQKFCRNSGPNNLIAANSLRDLYITVNGTDQEGVELECQIKCTHRGVGTALPTNFVPTIEPKCTCGQKAKTDRIVNGFTSKKSEYPWLVAMVEAQTRQPFCGASILNDRMILTAAHCFKGKYMDYRTIQLILAGEVLDVMPNGGKETPEPKTYSPKLLEKLDKGNGSVRLNVEEIIIHPLYVSETNDFDIALVKTVERINITWKGQTPVCLPKLGSYDITYAHKMAIVAGWGLADAEATGTQSQLQKLNVTVFSQKDCKHYYIHRVNKRMMCAGYKEGGRDSCMGDSGGPLVIETRPKVWTQVGTVSWGEGCAAAENPGVYYRLTETGQWINYVSNMQGATWCQAPKGFSTSAN